MPNPVIPVEAADPHIALFGDRYYIYATFAGKTEPGFTAWSSPDLVTWRNEGMALRLSEVGWAEGRDWAPGIIERNGTYYLYFSADDRIGVAVSDSPAGPFKDPLGEPLVPYKDDISVIDPMPFIDDDGQAYLYWGAVPATWLEGKVREINTHLSVHKLRDDMISLAGTELPTVEVASDRVHIEGSFLVKREGLYYLMWSEGNWNASDDVNSYRVAYAVSTSPTGPWMHAANNPILSSDWGVDVVGPGHHSVLQIPGTDDYYIAYHKHSGDGSRRVCVDTMEFAPDAAIREVRPTREGPRPVPASLSIATPGGGPFRAGQTISLYARSAREPQDVASVQFFAGAVQLGEVQSAPFRLDWDAAPAGFHRVYARAMSRLGATATSASLNLDVG